MVFNTLCMSADSKMPFAGSPITMLLLITIIIVIVVLIVKKKNGKGTTAYKERECAVGDKITTINGETGQIISLSNTSGEIRIKISDSNSIISITKKDILINHSIRAEQIADKQLQEEDIIYKPITTHILLCLFTFGIWYFIWIYRATEYLNRAPDGEQYDPTNKLLLCLFVPFYQIYWFYKHGQKLDSLMKEKRIESSEMATLCLILGIFVPIVACILMQDRFNQLCTTIPQNQTTEKASIKNQQVTRETAAIDDLKKYKELLDTGVITQEEFDAKKKQLLGL